MRIRIEAISCQSYSILLIANGVAGEIDLSISKSATLAIKGDGYETPQEAITVKQSTRPTIEIVKRLRLVRNEIRETT